MKTLEERKKEFEERFDTYIKIPNYSVGWTANRDEVWDFIESTISQTKQELIEKFLDDLGYAYIHDKDGRKNIEVLIGMYNIKLEELKKLSNK